MSNSVTPWTPACQKQFLFCRTSSCLYSLSHARLLETPWTVACQAPLSMARILDWNGLLFPSPRNLPKPLICLRQSHAGFPSWVDHKLFFPMSFSPKQCWELALLSRYRMLYFPPVVFFFFSFSLLRKHRIVSFKVLFIEKHLSISFLKYWNIVYLQCCISFSYTAKWLLYLYTCPLFFSLFSHIGHYRVLSRVPCTIQ